MGVCWRKIIVLLLIILIGGTASVLSTVKNLSAAEDLPTYVSILLICGDGFAEHISGEVCDPGDPPLLAADVGTSTCVNFNDNNGDPFTSGTLGCNSICTDYATSSCYSCGNDHKEEIESCDGDDFGGASCISFGFESGTLHCMANCQINTANCVARENQGGYPGSGRSGGSAGGASGFLPGTLESQETKVIMKGKSYPDSDVHILVDGKVVGIVRSDPKADFYFETSDVTPGIASFGFWSEDKLGLKSTLLTLTFRVISRAVTTITGIYIAPSIEVDKKSVKQGENIKIYGQTIPETKVNIHINSDEEIIQQTNSKGTGDWELVFNTAPLAEDFHTAKALFELETSGNVIKSGFSRSVSFAVGKIGGSAVCPNADLNKDGRVNLTDFSILLYYWGTDNACADQNQNGVVDLVDFSIMMYYWTG
jgi:hypothetical protein